MIFNGSVDGIFQLNLFHSKKLLSLTFSGSFQDENHPRGIYKHENWKKRWRGKFYSTKNFSTSKWSAIFSRQTTTTITNLCWTMRCCVLFSTFHTIHEKKKGRTRASSFPRNTQKTLDKRGGRERKKKNRKKIDMQSQP